MFSSFVFGTKFKQISRHHSWVYLHYTYMCVLVFTQVHNGKWPGITLRVACLFTIFQAYLTLFVFTWNVERIIYIHKIYYIQVMCVAIVFPHWAESIILPDVSGEGEVGTRLPLNYIEMKTKCFTALPFTFIFCWKIVPGSNQTGDRDTTPFWKMIYLHFFIPHNLIENKCFYNLWPPLSFSSLMVFRWWSFCMWAVAVALHETSMKDRILW